MIRGVDSSFARPTDSVVAQEIAAGTKLWSGYIATKQGVGLAAAWPRSDFEEAKKLGCPPIGYCSGWDDPVALKNLAAQWGVRLCLDVEGGIRGDGPWVQAFLDASGAGLYGNNPVFAGRRAAFYIEAAYPGHDPGVTWPSGNPRPNGPCGWQWQGTHTEFGDSVDRGNFDDWFATPLGGDLQAMGSFRPGTHEYHWAVINDDKSVDHCYVNLDKPIMNADGSHNWQVENLGGIAGGYPDLTWSPDGQLCVMKVVGSDSKSVCLNVWQGGKWGGWANTKALDFAVPLFAGSGGGSGVTADQVKQIVAGTKLAPS